MKKLLLSAFFLLFTSSSFAASTFYLDFEGGNDGNDGTTFANRWKTFASGATAARTAPGDTIRIMASPDATSLGQTATWTNKSNTVTLSTAVTKTLFLDGAWTAATNVTCNTTTSRKEGSTAANIAVASGFTTGLIAYYDLGSTQDLSAYNQISFWMRPDVSSASQLLQIKLCSDAAGATPVETLNIKAQIGAATYRPVTIDKGSALSSTVRSIALYATSDPGTVTYAIDNVIAAKDSTAADSISLTSLISKNSGDETWWAIASIDTTTVKLDQGPNSLVGTATFRGYSGTTETVTTYKRETVKVLESTLINDLNQAVQESGSAGNLITYSGGWNRTDMTTQTGETWVDGSNGFGVVISPNAKTFGSFTKLFAVRGNGGFNFSTGSSDWSVGEIGANNNQGGGIVLTSGATRTDITTIKSCSQNGAVGLSLQGLRSAITTVSKADSNTSHGIDFNNSTLNWIGSVGTASNNVNSGIAFSSTLPTDNEIGSVTALNDNGGSGVDFQTTSTRNVIRSITAANANTARGITFGGCSLNRVYNASTSGNAQGVSNTSGENYLFNTTIAEATEFTGITAGIRGKVISVKHDASATGAYIYQTGGNIQSSTGVKETPAAFSWKMSPTSSTEYTSRTPLIFKVGRVAVGANTQVTATLRMYLSDTGITAGFRVKGGQIAGVASDVSTTAASVATTWEDVQITFTPTEAGVVELEAWCYGGTTYSAYAGKLTVSQA